MMDNQQKQPNKDQYVRLKYIAYCWANLPPKDAGITRKDFIKYAQFFLCYKTKRLMKDPIWETYTVEEILIEYFSYMFVEDKNFKEQFEQKFETADGVDLEEAVDEFLSFIDKVNKKEEKKLEDEAAKLPDSLSFKPQKD